MSYSIEQFKNTIISRGGPVYASKFLVTFPSVDDVVMTDEQREAAAKIDAISALDMAIYREAKNLPKDLSFLCSSATIPGIDLQAIQIQDYGPEHSIASGMAAGANNELKLNIVLTKDLAPYYYFRDWMSSIVNETNWEIKFPNQYRKQMSLFLLGHDAKAIWQLDFTDVWPDNIADLPVDWGKTELIHFTVSMTFRWMKRKNPMDTLPI